VIRNFHAWHVQTGFFSYPMNHVTIDGYVVRGEFSYLPYTTVSSYGITISDYLAANTVIKNADIQGMRVGISVPNKMGDTRDTGQVPGTFVIQDSYLNNYTDVYVETMSAVTGGSGALTPRLVTMRNVRFDVPTVTDVDNDPHYTIMLNYLTSPDVRTNYNWV